MWHNGRRMKETTVGEVHAMTVDLDDTWVILPGWTTLVEVWDLSEEIIGGNVILFGDFPDTAVPLDHKIYYTA